MVIREERATSDIRVHPVVVTAMVGLLGWMVLAGVAIGLGALVTQVVVGHTLGRGDLELARWFAEHRTDTWNSVSRAGSLIVEPATVVVVLAIALGVLAVRRAWPQFGLLAVTMAAEGGMYLVATYFVSRNRPAVPRLEDLIASDSYPSGHAAAAVAMYGTLCIVVWSLTRLQAWRAAFLALAVIGPLVVATARVYRGMHNVTDVVCGMFLGAGCIVVGYVAVRAGLTAARRRAEPSARRPASSVDDPALGLAHGAVR